MTKKQIAYAINGGLSSAVKWVGIVMAMVSVLGIVVAAAAAHFAIVARVNANDERIGEVYKRIERIDVQYSLIIVQLRQIENRMIAADARSENK